MSTALAQDVAIDEDNACVTLNCVGALGGRMSAFGTVEPPPDGVDFVAEPDPPEVPPEPWDVPGVLDVLSPKPVGGPVVGCEEAGAHATVVVVSDAAFDRFLAGPMLLTEIR